MSDATSHRAAQKLVVQDLREAAAKARERADELNAQADVLRNQIRALWAEITDLEATADRLEKIIGDD